MKKVILSLIILITLFFGCSKTEPIDSNNCSQPNYLGVDNLTNTTAYFSWSVDSNSSLFQLEYGVLGFELGTGTNVSVSQTYLAVENLTPQTQYSFYVKVYCNESENYSDWAGPYAFVTLDHNPYCDDPSNLNVDYYSNSVSYNYIDLIWEDANSEGAQVEYGVHGFTQGSGTIKTINDWYPTSTRINGLSSDTLYDFYVRNICESSGYSSWIGPFTQSTKPEPYNSNCLDPVNFTLDEIYTNSSGGDVLVFSWDAINGENTWQLHQVRHGNDFNTGSTLDTSYNPIQLTNYTYSGVEYDFYVRSHCSTDGYSGWTGPITLVGP